MQNRLATEGWALMPSQLDATLLESLRQSAFRADGPGQRCLLDLPIVRDAACQLRTHLIAEQLLPPTAIAIQAIAFDKNPSTNWKVGWHQDVMFPFAQAVTAPGFTLPSVKDHTHYARPPVKVLADLLAVRLHIDDCDTTNGPLRVCPGSHREGLLRSADLPSTAARYQETTCLAREGESLLMRPLLLHASSPATTPRHRRVLHLVYHTGTSISEPWHRAI